MKSFEIPNPTMPCQECSAGLMRKTSVTYFTWLGQELITVLNFPAWVCDVCGKRVYDQDAEKWLNALLKPDAGKTTIKQKKTRGKPSRKTQPPVTDPKITS
jgi:YgiT-type zinc finger domain-containing protein